MNSSDAEDISVPCPCCKGQLVTGCCRETQFCHIRCRHFNEIIRDQVLGYDYTPLWKCTSCPFEGKLCDDCNGPLKTACCSEQKYCSSECLSFQQKLPNGLDTIPIRECKKCQNFFQ
jgi:hypothetical protein